MRQQYFDARARYYHLAQALASAATHLRQLDSSELAEPEAIIAGHEDPQFHVLIYGTIGDTQECMLKWLAGAGKRCMMDLEAVEVSLYLVLTWTHLKVVRTFVDKNKMSKLQMSKNTYFLGLVPVVQPPLTLGLKLRLSPFLGHRLRT